MSLIYETAGDLWNRMKRDYDAELERRTAQADEVCIGYLVNKAGRSKGLTARDLFTGPADRAYRYATRELIDFWQAHPHITLAQFEAEWLFTRGGLEDFAAAAHEGAA